MTKFLTTTAAVLLAAQPALAADFTFSFETLMINGDTARGNGTLTADDLGNGRFQVTGGTGAFFGYEGDEARTLTGTDGAFDFATLSFGPAILFESSGAWATDFIRFRTTGNDFTFFNRTSDGRYSFATSEVGAGDVALTIAPLAAAVPEPATWATMIGGFALVGAALRRRARAATLAA